MRLTPQRHRLIAPRAIGQRIETRGRGAEKLTVDASDTAQGFFAKRGYVAMQRNSITINDEWLANTTMQKALGAAPSPGVPS